MANPIIAMLFGLAFTITLHIAKSMERHGIEIFDQIRAKIKKTDEENPPEGLKKPTIYIVGFTLNNIVFIFEMASNATAGEGMSAYFTSMFGIGLIVLMIYSAKILKEEIILLEYVGAAIIILGTLLIGIDGISNPFEGEIDKGIAFIIIGIFAAISAVLIIIGYKNSKPTIVGLFFGFVAGGFGGLDMVLKDFGQEGGVLPSDFIGWIIFLSSFASGTVAMLMTQWGFAKKANASTLVPVYNSMYIVLPIVISWIARSTYSATPLSIIGVIVTLTGIIVMRAFKKETKKKEPSTTSESEV